MANGLGEYFGQEAAAGAPPGQGQFPQPTAGPPPAFAPVNRMTPLTPPSHLPQISGTGEYFAQNGTGYFGQNGMGAFNMGPVPGSRKPGAFRRAAASVSPFAGALGEVGDAVSDAKSGAITGVAAATTVTVILIGLGIRFGAGYVVGKALAPSMADESKYAWGGGIASALFGSVGLGVEALVAANARK